MQKHKCKKSITGPGTGATPSKERRNQNGGLIWEAIPSSIRPGQLVRRYRAVWESPLDAYRAYGVINREEYRAGLRFHRAYYGVVLCRRADFRPTSDEHASSGDLAIWPASGIWRQERFANQERGLEMLGWEYFIKRRQNSQL